MVPALHSSSPTSNSSSPLSPNSISLKPNVNRAKTKRWVEAKQYSYDGNDWGDEDDEFDDDEPPAVSPQTTSNSAHRTADASGLPRPSMPAMDRSKSMDQVLTVDPDSASGSRSQSVDGRNAATSSHGAQSSSRAPAPFVRPADIYKRMREEKARETSPVATRANFGPVSASPRASAVGPESTASPSSRERPTIALPEVKRLSGINTDVSGGSRSNAQNTQNLKPEQQHSLQHNPSTGFRSAVNQAFDVPETPASVADSVGRSNSDSTSAVSPIMTSRGYNEGKTPTIVEEPGEVTTPKDGSDRSIVFKPGHRRDLSVPSPDNSPSRKPDITDNEPTPPSAYPQIFSSTLGDSSEDPIPPLQNPKRTSVQLPNAPARDLPAPLRVSSNQTSFFPSIEAAQNAPSVDVPSLSTETSPQDTENDRLRKEIIRSLSPENTPSDGPEQGSRPETRETGRDSAVPSEYESYWNQDPARSPEQLNPEHNKGLSANELSAGGPPPAPWQGSQPKLTRKFSWESSSSDALEPPDTSSELMQDPPIPGQLPPDDAVTPPLTGTEEPIKPTPEKPKLTIIPPSAGDESSIFSGHHLPEVVSPQPEPAVTDFASQQPAITAISFSQQPILGFRDILGIKSSDERVRQFDRTRTQFESIDTGLSHWLQVTLQTHPEHGDIVSQSTKLSVGAPKGRSKFPKLPSFGNLGASSSSAQPVGPPPGHGHVRRSSAPLNKQQVEQRGKDLLHTAGMLGGRAGGVAKGLFARGRSKFKGNGEKVDD